MPACTWRRFTDIPTCAQSASARLEVGCSFQSSDIDACWRLATLSKMQSGYRLARTGHTYCHVSAYRCRRGNTCGNQTRCFFSWRVKPFPVNTCKIYLFEFRGSPLRDGFILPKPSAPKKVSEEFQRLDFNSFVFSAFTTATRRIHDDYRVPRAAAFCRPCRQPP